MSPALVSGASAWQDGLIERCAGGDELAWSHLYRQHEESARRFLLRMGVSEEALEDTCQEVFLQAFRYLPQFRGECSFRTWLYRICVSEARRSRSRQRFARLIGTLLGEQYEPITSGDLGQARSERLVQEALSRLSEKERLVFVAYELEGLSGKEVASVAGCPEPTVWTRLHHARELFRDYVREQGVMP